MNAKNKPNLILKLSVRLALKAEDVLVEEVIVVVDVVVVADGVPEANHSITAMPNLLKDQTKYEKY
jgi:alkylhydroperoxidase/carboxymuconolactone decarboxylase family protein YurZ